MSAPTVATPLQQTQASQTDAPPRARPRTHTHDHAHAGGHDHDHAHAEVPRAATVPGRSPITVGAFGRLAVASGLTAALWLIVHWALA